MKTSFRNLSFIFLIPLLLFIFPLHSRAVEEASTQVKDIKILVDDGEIINVSMEDIKERLLKGERVNFVRKQEEVKRTIKSEWITNALKKEYGVEMIDIRNAIITGDIDFHIKENLVDIEESGIGVYMMNKLKGHDMEKVYLVSSSINIESCQIQDNLEAGYDVNLKYNVIFKKPVVFNSSTIKKASYRSASFKEKVYFDKASFNDVADFGYVYFNDKASFENSSFNSEADFWSASFNGGAYFENASFKEKVSFENTSFNSEASYRSASFEKKAYFDKASFNGKAYFDASFNGRTSFEYADFKHDVNFRDANFNGDVSFVNANLSWVNLSSVNLSGVNLSEANLIGTDLSEAKAIGTNFKKSFFDPRNIDGLNILGAKGFSSIKFENIDNIVNLRKVAKDAGFKDQERQLTAALRKKRFSVENLRGRIFENVFLDYPTDYGANPWRCLQIFCALFLAFSIPYMIVLKKRGQDGIFKVWSIERARIDLGENKPVRLTLVRGSSFLWYGLYFSLLSAFHIGWRDLNVGSWIARIQPREYSLKATGWVRVVSGVHSFISIYLLALWALTYFGRPFE